MTKIVYAYATDGKYIGERTLDDTDRSPISGMWQIPAYMTEVKPPGTKEGYDLYYKDGKWTQVERPKSTPEPTPQEDTEPHEPYIDPDRLTLYEALAAQESRLTELEAKLKGGEGK